MTKKNYTEEFRRDAVELYRDTDGAIVAGIAANLGISHGSLTTSLKTRVSRSADTAPAVHRGQTWAQHPSRKPPGSAPRSRTCERRKPSPRPSGISCGLRPNISPERRIDGPFPVSCRPLRCLPVKRYARSSISLARRTTHGSTPPRNEPPWARAHAELAEKIRAHSGKDLRITAEINDGQPAGKRVNHKRIARIVRENRGPEAAPKTPHHHRRTSLPGSAHRSCTEHQICR